MNQRYLKILIPLLVLIYLIYIFSIITREIQLSFSIVKAIPIEVIFISVMLSLFSYLVRFKRWLLYLQPLSSNISIKKHAQIYFTGYAFTTSPGKVGETIRSVYLAPLGINYTSSLAAFVSERSLDLIAVTLLATLYLSTFNYDYISVLLIAIVFIVFIVCKNSDKAINKLNIEKFNVSAVALKITIKKFFNIKLLKKTLPLSLLSWTIQGLVLVLIINQLGYEANTWILISIYSVSILAGAASLIPGGIGATEASISLLLINIGIPAEYGITAAIVTRSTTLMPAILIGTFCMITSTKQATSSLPNNRS